MNKTITQEQYDEICEAKDISATEYSKCLEKICGITAHRYTAFFYEDERGNYLGNDDTDIDELLDLAQVKVEWEGV